VDDQWYVTRKQPDGNIVKERTTRHGSGKRWLVRWRDAEGQPRKKAFARKADADREKSRIETELVQGTYIDPDAGLIRFRDYAERWRKAQFDDPNTSYQVGLRLRRHVYPAFGRMPLRAINPSTIRDWLHGLTMERSYQRTIFANVSQIFTAAVADELIGKNPCSSKTVRKPSPDPRMVEPWPATWVAGVRAHLPERYAVLVTLAAGTGLRQGEIFGLSADDIDVKRGLVNVRRQVKLSASNQPYFALPKGRKTRTVPIPSAVSDELNAYLADFPARTASLPWGRPDGEPVAMPLILTSRESKALNRHYFNAQIWKPALISAGVPPTRDNGCHALRHFYASVLLDGGESSRTVSERLGHSDPAFTLRVYTHLLPSSESRTKDIVEAAIRALPHRSAARREAEHRRPTARPGATDMPRQQM
jgi:integrase